MVGGQKIVFTAEAQRTQRGHVCSFLLRGQKGTSVPLNNFNVFVMWDGIVRITTKLKG